MESAPFVNFEDPRLASALDHTTLQLMVDAFESARKRLVRNRWETISERALRAVDEFHAAHPTAGEPVFVTAESFEAGVPDLPAITNE